MVIVAALNANELTVRAWLEAGDRGEFESFDRYLHHEVVVHAPLGLSSVGVEAERTVWADVKRAVPDIKHDVQETISDGASVVARVIVTGTIVSDVAGIHATGQTFQVDQAVIAHFRDGLIVEAWEIADTGSLLRQVGATD